MSGNRKIHLLLLILLTLCWGPSFFLIKIALKEVSVITITTARIFFAGLFLLAIIAIQKKSLWKWRGMTKHFLVMSFIGNIPIFLINYAETTISSSLAGIINASQPIFASVLAHYILETERFSLKSLIGISTGFSGILFIFLPPLFGVAYASGWGVFIMVLSALANSASAVYAKRFLFHTPPIICATYQFAWGIFWVAPIAFFMSTPSLFHIPSWSVLSSLVLLGVFSSAIAYIIFYYLVKYAGAIYVSTCSLLLPFVAIGLGLAFLSEHLYWTSYIGCLLILVGLVITNSLIDFKVLRNRLQQKDKKPDR